MEEEWRAPLRCSEQEYMDGCHSFQMGMMMVMEGIVCVCVCFDAGSAVVAFEIPSFGREQDTRWLLAIC